MGRMTSDGQLSSPIMNAMVDSIVDDFEIFETLFSLFVNGNQSSQECALRTLLSESIGPPVQKWFLDRCAVSTLINYASRPALTSRLRELALRLLVSVTFELSNSLAYPADLDDSHYRQLSTILIRSPSNIFYVLWTLYELSKFESGRRAVIGTEIPLALGRIAVSRLDSKVVCAALYLLCDLAGDEICADVLVKLDLFRMFRVTLHRYVIAGVERQVVNENEVDQVLMRDFVNGSEHHRMKIRDADVLAAYYRLYDELPPGWKDVEGPWCELILTMAQHCSVVRQATLLGQPISECLQSILLLAPDHHVVRLMEIVSNLVLVQHNDALNWIFRDSFVQLLLKRYPWRKFAERSASVQQLMEEALMLVVHVLDAVSDKEYSAAYAEKLRKDYELDVIFQMCWPRRLNETLASICRLLNCISSG